MGIIEQEAKIIVCQVECDTCGEIMGDDGGGGEWFFSKESAIAAAGGWEWKIIGDEKVAICPDCEEKPAPEE